jgi:hypothetical protein
MMRNGTLTQTGHIVSDNDQKWMNDFPLILVQQIRAYIWGNCSIYDKSTIFGAKICNDLGVVSNHRGLDGTTNCHELPQFATTAGMHVETLSADRATINHDGVHYTGTTPR